MTNAIVASSLVFAAFLIICICIYYFLNLKGMKARKKYLENLHKNVTVGKNIIFCGGIYARILKVDGDTVEVATMDGSKMKISRYVITEILN